MFGADHKDKVNEQEKQWNIFLGEYGYQYNDEFNLLISEAVKKGYVPQDNLQKEARGLNQQFVELKSISSFDDAWGLFHNSFSDNQTEVVNGLYHSFTDNAQWLKPGRLDNIVQLFRDLGEEKKADELINIYIEAHKENKYIFDLKYDFFDINDVKIKERFAELAAKDKVVRSAQEVLADISGRNVWSQEDEEILANTNSEEFYKIFKENNGKHLLSYIYTCLKFSKFINASEKQQKITSNATIALKKIADESPLNRARMRKFDIEL